VLNGYTDAAAAIQTSAPTEEMSSDMQGYLAASGVQTNSAAPTPSPTPAAPGADPYRLQPTAAQMVNPGRHVFADVGEALEVSLDNTNKGEFAQQSGFPNRVLRANAHNARGIALTVTGDGSGALLVIQAGPWKDYVVPIDFTGRKDIFIPLSEVSHATGGWGMRFAAKGALYGIFDGVFIGFGRVPANTKAKVLIEDLRMVGEKPSSVKNPVIYAGAGTLAIQGEVKSGEYLWYQGGGKVGLYDKNWKLLGELPAVATNYEVDKGFSEYWIDGECLDPVPWFDVQFITKGETITLDAAPAAAAAKTNP